MADFASLINQSAMQSTQPQNLDLAGNLKQGAALAMQKEQLLQEKQKLQQAKKSTQETKISKFTNALFKAQKFKDPSAKKNYMKKVLPKVRDVYGLQEMISDDTLETLASSDENVRRAMALNLAVRNGTLSSQESIEIANDKVRFADVEPIPEELMMGDSLSLSEAQEKFLSEQGKNQRTLMREQAQESRFLRREDRQSFQAFDRRVADFSKQVEKRVKPRKDVFDSLKLAKGELNDMVTRLDEGEALTPKDLSTLQKLGTPLARGVLAEKGMLSDGDIRRATQEAGLQGRLKEFGEFISSRPNPDRVRQFKKLVDSAHSIAEERLTEEVSSMNNQLESVPVFQGNVEQAREAVGLTPVQERLPGEGAAAEGTETTGNQKPIPSLNNPKVLEKLNNRFNGGQLTGTKLAIEMSKFADRLGITVEELGQKLDEYQRMKAQGEVQ